MNLGGNEYVIIDIDKYRWKFNGYYGRNPNETGKGDEAKTYNSAAIDVANKVYKFCIRNNLKLILDGTFSNINLAKQNIDQCIKKGRDFSLVYVYQNPLFSFAFTKARGNSHFASLEKILLQPKMKEISISYSVI